MEGESEFFLRLNPVGVKRMASLHKVSSSVHTLSTVKLTKGVEDWEVKRLEEHTTSAVSRILTCLS
jgi:uncharacterized protein